MSEGRSWIWYDEAFVPVATSRTLSVTPRSAGVFTLRLATITADGVATAVAEIPVVAP